MENLLTFIPEFLLILIASIYVMGIYLKGSSIPDKYITSILMIFGISIAILLNIINAKYGIGLEVIVNGILHGILCWGVAIGVNQTAKQLVKEE